MHWWEKDWHLEWEKLAKTSKEEELIYFPYHYDIKSKDVPNNFNNLEDKESK